MARWVKVNDFLIVNGEGKVQNVLGTPPADAYFDTRENCTVEINLQVERGKQLNCNNRDILGEPLKSRYVEIRLTYDNPTAQQIFRQIAYFAGSVTSPTGTPANEVQRLTRSGLVSGGSFPLTMPTFEGRTGVSRAIPYNATAAQIQAAITNSAASIGKVIKPGDVVVSGDWDAGMTLTFAKRLRNANLPLLTVGNGAITGGGSVINTQITAGEQNYHTAQRTDDTSKVLFAVAFGNKAASSATQKYFDCVSQSINFTLDSEQTNAQMQVVIGCNYNPDTFTSFALPACTNAPPVLTADARLVINNVFRQKNLVNHAIALNDNVPVAAMFGFDDPDISVPPVAGKEPSQDFTTELYFDHADTDSVALRQLALDEHVEGNEVGFITHLGNPGNRVSIIAEECKIKPQSQLDGHAGPAEQSTTRITSTPHGITDLPIKFEAYLDQSVPFLEPE